MHVVKSMVDNLNKISEEECTLVSRKLSPYIEELEIRMQKLSDSDEDKFEFKKLEELENKLDTYVNRMPVIGFNSGN